MYAAHAWCICASKYVKETGSCIGAIDYLHVTMTRA